MNKAKANDGESVRSVRRRSLPSSLKNYDFETKLSERVTRNLRQNSVGDTANSSSNANAVRVRKRKSLPVPNVATKKPTAVKSVVNTGAIKRKLTNKFPRRKRRRKAVNSDNESDVDNEDKSGVDKDAKSPESLDHESTVSDSEKMSEQQQTFGVAGLNSKLIVRNPFLVRKLKRETSIRSTQKYETERTDYIIEDRPSYIDTTKTKEYVCHDSVNEATLKSPQDSEDKLQTCSDTGSKIKTESQLPLSSAGKQTRLKTANSNINFQVGGRLEARDYLNMWYPSRIIQVDLENREILIHFERWNSRFDEWVSMDSPRLRPITRSSIRRDHRGRRPSALKNFKIGEIVYAKWTDCKMYPAKILSVKDDDSYTVLFYDGFERDVQFINVRKLPPELVGKVNFNPSAVTKVTEEKQRRLSGTKTTESLTPVEIETVIEDDKSSLESLPKSKEDDDSVEASTSKVTPGIASNKRNKLLVGGIFQAKRQQTKVNVGGVAVSKTKRQSVEKSSSGRSTPTSITKQTDSLSDKEAKSVTDDKQKSKGSLSSPLLVRELSKAPISEPTFGVPTKAFLIEEDHNHFKCTVAGCGKSFRKDVLLASHMKHYHATPKTTISGKKSLTPCESKEEAVEQNVTLESTADTVSSEISVLAASMLVVEGNLERKLITEKRRQLLMQRKLDSMTKKKEQHISDVIASVAKKFNPSSPEKTPPENSIKEVTPKSDKPKTSPKRRKYFFTSKVMSKIRRMKMGVPGRRFAALDDGPHEELINCSCEQAEEDGLMMQCEVCLAWQHGACFGIEDENKVPEKYICHICKNPKGLRSSFRYCFNQDWFKTGEMASFKFLPPRNTWNLRNNVYKTHGLAGQILNADNLLHSLRCKLQLTKNSSHSDLKKWARPWAKKTVESSLVDKLGIEEGGEKSANGIWGFSDHCYSVQNQEFPNDSLVDENGLFFNDSSKGLCFEVAANEEVLDVEGTTQTDVGDRNGEASVPSDSKLSPDATTPLGNGDAANDLSSESSSVLNSTSKTEEVVTIKTELSSLEECINTTDENVVSDEKLLKNEETTDTKVSQVVDDPLKWQLNLLDHVENVQLEVDSRLDDITKRLETLEAEYECSEGNAEKDPHFQIARTKRLLSCIVNDLSKVRRLALYR